MKHFGLLSCFLTATILFAAPVRAQAVRTWVSGVGDDANPCARTAPCKTFAGAISKTAAGGEISVLDPGGFGALTITKSISLVSDGQEAGITAAGTNGITVNAGANDVVSIRGLQIEGGNTGINGIRILQAKSVTISRVVVRGFNGGLGHGIDISTSAASFVFLNDVEVNNNKVGIFMHAGATTTGLIMNRVISQANSATPLTMDTSTSFARAFGSVFATNAVSVTNGAQLVSAGNNFFTGGTGPTSTSPLQ